ncbi:MAG: Crp/Fnr family transcriptional regulator [Oscillospiraceae bacterium]
MELEAFFPGVWDKLTDAQRRALESAASPRRLEAGEQLSGAGECVGLLAVRSGRLRAYMISDTGREITLYRLFERDICLFSASCVMRGLQFDVSIEAEQPSEVLVVSPEVYKRVMEESAPLANYTNELMASRFSEVMWLVEQILWKSFDRRLAAFLLEESALESSDELRITHERIAAHLGTAREVVTRMLRYFQSEGLVSLSRGTVRIADRQGLEALAE